MITEFFQKTFKDYWNLKKINDCWNLQKLKIKNIKIKNSRLLKFKKNSKIKKIKDYWVKFLVLFTLKCYVQS